MPTDPLVAGPVPLYQQLKLRLRDEITHGTYAPGDQLPSEPEMIRMFGVSRITVRQALSELEAEGLVVRRHGKGTYVADRRVSHDLVRLTDFVEDMELAGLAPSSLVQSFGREPASDDVAATLSVAPGTNVVRVERLRLADSQPIAYDITWLPLRYGALLDPQELTSETIFHVLENRFDVPITEGSFAFTAACADEKLSAQLEVERGAPLLVIERISYTRHQDPIYLQRRYYRTDRVRYRATLHRQSSQSSDVSGLRELRPIFTRTEAAAQPDHP